MTTATRNGKATTASEIRTITLPALSIETWEMRIIGETPLIAHRFGEDAIRQIEKGQGDGPKVKKAARDPVREFEQASYRLEDGRYAFPAGAIKRCMTIAGMRFAEEKGTELMGKFSIPVELLHLDSPAEPRMRTDRVKIGMGTTSLTYRPEFFPWSLTFPIRFAFMSIDQLFNILTIAGFSVGIGDWRVDKKGVHGQFRVDETAMRRLS